MVDASQARLSAGLHVQTRQALPRLTALDASEHRLAVAVLLCCAVEKSCRHCRLFDSRVNAILVTNTCSYVHLDRDRNQLEYRFVRLPDRKRPGLRSLVILVTG